MAILVFCRNLKFVTAVKIDIWHKYRSRHFDIKYVKWRYLRDFSPLSQNYYKLFIFYPLTDSKDPKQYIKRLRQSDDELSKGWVQFVHTLTVETAGGKQRMNCADLSIKRQR